MDAFLARSRVVLRQPNFVGLLVATVALGMAFSFVIPFLSMWGTQEIKMRPFVFGAFMMVTSLSAIILTTALARWSDTHVSRKTMLILGGSGGAFGYCGYAFVRDPAVLIVIGSTCLALASVCFSQLFAYVRESTAAETANDRSFRMSLVRVSFSVAWTVGPAIGAAMMARFGFRGVFLGAAGLYLLFLAGVLRFVPFEKRTQAMRTAVRQPVWQVLTRGDIGACFAAFMLFFAAQTIHMMNLPLLVTNVLHGTPGDLGIMFGIGPVVEIPLMLWFSHLAARGHQLRLIRIGALVPVIYFLVLLLVRAPWQIYPLQILHGVIFAIMSNVAIVFFQDLVPGQPGLATTIFGNASSGGNIAGYFCFGAVLEALSSHGVVYVCAGLSACTLVILLLYRHRASVAMEVTSVPER